MDTQTFIPTGSAALDQALGTGGIPRGRMTHIFGNGRADPAVTALTYGLVAAAQRAGGVCAFVDLDDAILPAAASRHGVDIEHLLISVPEHFEQATAIVDTLVRTGAVDLIVVRVDGANTARGSEDPLKAARRQAQWLRKLHALVARFTTAVVFVTCARELGEDRCEAAGSLDTALRFYTSVRVRVALGAAGAQAKVVKNKCAAPFGEAALGVGELV